MALPEFFGFLAIFKGSFILLSKNGKLVAFIAICSIVLYSTIFSLFTCSIQSLIDDLSAIILKPNPSAHIDQLKKYTALLIADEVAFGICFSVISFFLGIATIIVSATSYTETTLSSKDLFSLICKTCMRTLVATFYVVGLATGYLFCILMLASPLLIMYPNLIAMSSAAGLGIASYVLYVYLCVTWGLSIVVSVVEEDGYGVHALRRASVLVNRKRVQGFMLNFCFILVTSVVSVVTGMVFGNKGMVYGVLTVSFSSLIKIWVLAGYTVLYFHCKKHHGEEMNHGLVQYAKLPTGYILVEDMA